MLLYLLVFLLPCDYFYSLALPHGALWISLHLLSDLNPN